jgi:Raf kinase inhibitor-like YbhB/YbcL family protein
MRNTLLILHLILIYFFTAAPSCDDPYIKKRTQFRSSPVFDANSDNITNKYTPISSGSVMIYNVYSPAKEPTGMVQYWNCTGPDIVDGVKCLRVNRVNREHAHPDHPEWEVRSNILASDWYAQATDGAVYILQSLRYDQGTGSTMRTFGAANAVMRMGTEADMAANYTAEDITLSATGLGTFKECIKATDSFFGTFYFAPGIGAVRHVDPSGGFNELVSWEFPLAAKTSRYDITGDEKTGLEEAIYALQVATGMSSGPGIFQLSTDAFPNNEIPTKYTCKSADAPVSPPFTWTNPPLGTKSFVLIADNLDSVPVSGFALDHWLVYDIPSTETGLSENAAANLPSGAKHGTNREGKDEYSGPCAPDGSGINRYYFRLYALNIANLNPIQTNKVGIQAAMTGHVLGQTELVGTYNFAK